MSRVLPDGVYDHLLDDALAAAAERAAVERQVDIGDIPEARVPAFLAAHVRSLLKRVLESVPGDEEDRRQRRVEVTNAVLRSLLEAAAAVHGGAKEPPLERHEAHVSAARHLRLVRARPALGVDVPVVLPAIPLADSALLVNAAGEPSLGRELARELASADRVDLVCAFLSGAVSACSGKISQGSSNARGHGVYRHRSGC